MAAFASQCAYAYLAAIDPLPDAPADAVIGFGTFDLALARFCGALHAAGRARRIVFTGGIGAGTADLGQPEADAWREELLRIYPSIRAADVITENRSTNTAENVRFTADLLQRRHPDLAFGRGIRSVLIVAAPARLRRAMLTLAHLQPGVAITRCLPPTSFPREKAIHESKGIDYPAHLAGELDRIVTYPARGWIRREPLPARVAEAHTLLRLQP